MNRKYQVVDKNTVKFHSGWLRKDLTLNREGLTDNEAEIMVALRTNEYCDDLTDGAPWTFSLEWNTSIPKRAFRGVLSSLIKKGLVRTMDCGDGDTVTWLTEKGAERYSDKESWRGR